MNTQITAQYNIVNIILLESYFKREPLIDFNVEITNTINLEKDISLNDTPNNPEGVATILVNLIMELQGIQNESLKVYECKVKISGIFEKSGESDLNQEMFANINAPAIIYPFVREQIANLALKAGIGSIFIPPVNFFKIDKKDSSASEME